MRWKHSLRICLAIIREQKSVFNVPLRCLLDANQGAPAKTINCEGNDDGRPGADVGQRTNMRRFAKFAAKVINSSGFVIAGLFSDKQNQTTPALGTSLNQYRVPAYEPRTKRWHQHCASGLRLIRRPAARSIRAP